MVLLKSELTKYWHDRRKIYEFAPCKLLQKSTLHQNLKWRKMNQFNLYNCNFACDKSCAVVNMSTKCIQWQENEMFSFPFASHLLV